MEGVIAKLLKDFEDGRMNRRQLIQSLAMAAAAVAVPHTIGAQAPVGQIPPPNLANQPPMKFKAVSVDHISYQVADYKATRDFYVDLLGMEVSDDDGRSQCYLHFGDQGSFLLPRNGGRGGGRRGGAAPANPSAAATAGAAAPAMPPAPQAPAGNPLPRVDHISYKIQEWNTDRVQAELERRGIKPIGRGGFTPDTGGANGPKNYASFHVQDPDGFNLQISGDLKPGDRLWKG